MPGGQPDEVAAAESATKADVTKAADSDVPSPMGPADAEIGNWLAGMLGEPTERLEAIERLDDLGASAIVAATRMMRSGNADARRGAAAYLGIRVNPRDDEAIGELFMALNDPDAEVRHTALQAIDRLPRSQLVYALAGLTALAERRDEDDSFRVLAIRKLGSLEADGRPASETLGRLGRDDASSKVRLAAFSTLAKVAEPQFAEAFYAERLAGSQEVNERRLAAKWLGNATCTSAGLTALISAFSDAEKEVRMAANESLIGIGKPAVVALAEGLSAPESQVRQYCAFTLGKLGPLASGAADALRQATEDEDEQVRKLAEAALRLVQSGGD